MSISVMPFPLASPIPMLGRPLDWQRMCQETRHLPKDGPGQSEQRPVVAADLGHCGTGMTPKGKGGRKERKGKRGPVFAGACFRCLDPWRGRLAVTHSRGSAEGWDRLVADRAGPIGRTVWSCGGCQGPRTEDRGAAIGFFLVVTTFSLWLCWRIPSRRAPFASAMQVDSWAFALPFVGRGLPLGRG